MAYLKIENGTTTFSLANTIADEVTGKYGKQWKYTVLHDGQEKEMYASAGLHRELQSADAKPLDVLTVTRTGSGTETRYAIVKTPGSSVAGRPNEAEPSPDQLAAFGNLLEACLADAKAAFERLGIEPSVDALQRHASTLFIRAAQCREIVKEFAPKPEPKPDPDDIPF